MFYFETLRVRREDVYTICRERVYKIFLYYVQKELKDLGLFEASSKCRKKKMIKVVTVYFQKAFEKKNGLRSMERVISFLEKRNC